MSNEIKVGDTVRVSKEIPRCYVSWIGSICQDKDSVVTSIGEQYAEIRLCSTLLPEYHSIPTKYLVKVGAEKEAKYHKGEKVRYNGYVYEVEGLVGKNRYALKGLNFDLDEDMIEPYTEPTEQTEANTNVGSIKIPVEVDLSDSYWDAYAADLAKELALKVANKYNDPEQAAEYAVQTAEAVVAGLKRK